MKKLNPYLFILIHLVLGMAILIGIESLKLSFNASGLIFLAFLALNLLYVYLFRLRKDLEVYWSLKKLHYLLFGVLGGFVLVMLPVVLQVFFRKINFPGAGLDFSFSFKALFLTVVIVGWEELWFRGLFLNACLRRLSACHLSLLMGFLFMAMHALNPAIHLLEKGPALFFAGALLTVLYFYFKTIWLPLGLHLGNNFFGSVMKTADAGSFFGEDGYLPALILAALFFLFFVKLRHEQDQPRKLFR